jgi:predicted transcriptional regulator
VNKQQLANKLNKDKEWTLLKILRNNNLSRREQRTEEFDEWLRVNGYFK